MTDLGDLLAAAEDGVERAHGGAAGAAGVLVGARRAVRRRRAARLAREATVGAVATVAIGAVAWWGVGGGPGPTAPAATGTATPTATAAPTPTTTAAPRGDALQVVDPVPGAADLLAATGEGWTMVGTWQYRVGIDETGVIDPADMRSTTALQAPDGTVTTLFDDRASAGASIVAWQPGSPLAVAIASDADDQYVVGTLDLRTGVLEPTELMWDNQPLGASVTGETLWVSTPLPADLADGSRTGNYRPAGPGSRVAQDPALLAEVYGGDVAEHSGTLLTLGTDGSVRDLGEATLPNYLHPLSPDRTWLALRGEGGGWVGVDVRDGARHDLPRWPADESCRPVGWVDDAQAAVSCPRADGSWELWAVDVSQDAEPRSLAVSDVPLRDAWPLGDGRVAIGRVVMPAPCDTTSDPAVLEGGQIRSLTTGWSPSEHGGDLTVVDGKIHTSLNPCYAGGRSDPQRTVLVDPDTAEVTTLAWLESHRPGQVVVDGEWRVATWGYVTNR